MATAKKSRKQPTAANQAVWKTVLRLPMPLANRLKKAVKKLNADKESGEQVSLNTAINTCLEVWLSGG